MEDKHKDFDRVEREINQFNDSDEAKLQDKLLEEMIRRRHGRP